MGVSPADAAPGHTPSRGSVPGGAERPHVAGVALALGSLSQAEPPGMSYFALDLGLLAVPWCPESCEKGHM